MRRNLEKILAEIFAHKELEFNPPVLIDIGASGKMNERWKMIARYSICIAFDADDREMGYIEKEISGYKKLIVFNSIVSDHRDASIDFFMTSSPHCSSTLRPDEKELNKYEFGDLFKVERTSKLNCVHLPDVMQKLNITYIDWFKSDSQGTDLRLFKSLEDNLREKIMIAEFEPGIINAYAGEDKLHSLMSYMDASPFWLSSLEIKGSRRIHTDLLSSFSKNDRKKIYRSLKISPVWGEFVYFNNFESGNLQTHRHLLLGWVFATLLKQHGFALELIKKLKLNNNDDLTLRLESFSRNALMKPHHDLRNRIAGKINRLLKSPN